MDDAGQAPIEGPRSDAAGSGGVAFPARLRLVRAAAGGRAGSAGTAAGEGALAALVVTPNPRAARARGVRPVSLEGLARELLRPLRVQLAPELTRWRSLRSAVRQAWAPADVDGTARALSGTLRELLRAGLDGASRALSETASPRLAGVLEVARRYREDLAGRGLVDPAEALWRAARGGEEGAFPSRRLEVLGYPRLGAAEIAFLEAICAPGSALELPHGDGAAFVESRAVTASLRERGWRLEPSEDAAVRGQPAPQGSVQALRFPSREAEVRYALTEVKRLLAGGEPVDSVALVARADTGYGPVVRAVAWEYQLPVALSYAVPLRETPVGAWTATLAEAVREGLPFEAVARLLAHPWVQAPAAATAGETWWDGARSRHPRGADAWSELDARTAALAWPARGRRAEFLGRLREAWDRFGVAGGAQGRLDDLVAFQRLAGAAAGLGLPAEERISLAAFLRELDALLTLLTVPVEVGRRGVELHTPLALFGARYRHLFVLGVSEGELPRPVVDDPVLDFHERRAAVAAGLPLEDAAQAARREALSFRAVLWSYDAGAPGASLTLSFAEDRGIASPYLGELGLTPSRPPPKPPASPEERRRQRILAAGADAGDVVLAAARRAWTVERRREEAAAPDRYDGVVGEPYPLTSHVFSATQLLDLGQCPFRWLCRVPLSLAEPDEAEEDMSPLLRGRLYHRALELALSAGLRAAGESAPAQALRDAAATALEGAFATAEEEEGATAVPGWELRRGHHLEQVRRVLASDSFLPDGAQVAALERWFPARGDAPPLWRGLRVRGKVDRVDRRAGGLVMLDYKTRGSRPSGAQDEHGKARVDLQLPLYLEAAAPALFQSEPVAGAQYYSLTKAEVLQEVRLDEDAQRALDGVASRARARLAAGSYPVAPDVDLKACATCDFDLVCRKGPRTERKRGAGVFVVAGDHEQAEEG